MEAGVWDARVVALAMCWEGTPYRHQASLRGVGCDCLGLVRGVWRELHGAEPAQAGAYSRDWAEAGGQDRLLAAALRHCDACEQVPAAGRILLFRWRPQLPAKHCGIAIGPDAFIHAYEGHSVMVSPLVPQWRRRIAGVFRFPQPDGISTASEF